MKWHRPEIKHPTHTAAAPRLPPLLAPHALVRKCCPPGRAAAQLAGLVDPWPAVQPDEPRMPGPVDSLSTACEVAQLEADLRAQPPVNLVEQPAHHTDESRCMAASAHPHPNARRVARTIRPLVEVANEGYCPGEDKRSPDNQQSPAPISHSAL